MNAETTFLEDREEVKKTITDLIERFVNKYSFVSRVDVNLWHEDHKRVTAAGKKLTERKENLRFEITI